MHSTEKYVTFLFVNIIFFRFKIIFFVKNTEINTHTSPVGIACDGVASEHSYNGIVLQNNIK